MSRADRKAGYAILGVLLITALAVLAGGALLSVALSAADVAHGDQENEAACAAAETGLSDALERLRWGWADDGSASGTVTVGLPGGESYSFTCRTSAGERSNAGSER